MIFKDRTEAGKLLANKLLRFKNKAPIVLAIPRGGVPVAYEVANLLHAELSIILIKKIGHPKNKEYAIGAVGTDEYFISPGEEASKSYIEEEVSSIRFRLKEMKEKFMPGKEDTDIKNRIVIVVDDGIATGKTMLVTVSALRKSDPKKIIVAVPVASGHSVIELSQVADEVITVENPNELFAIGSFYESFNQITDEDVIQILNKKELNLAAI